MNTATELLVSLVQKKHLTAMEIYQCEWTCHNLWELHIGDGKT